MLYTVLHMTVYSSLAEAAEEKRISDAAHVELDRSETEKLLIELDMTKGELAKKMGIDPSTLAKWLRNRRQPTRDQAAVMAYILRVPLERIARDNTCPHCGSAVAA